MGAQSNFTILCASCLQQWLLHSFGMDDHQSDLGPDLTLLGERAITEHHGQRQSQKAAAEGGEFELGS